MHILDIYIDDLHNAVSNPTLNLFADNVALFFNKLNLLSCV